MEYVLHEGIWYRAAPNIGAGRMPCSPAEAFALAPLLLEDAEVYELRPEEPNAVMGRFVAYGVKDGRYRRLPVAVVVGRLALKRHAEVGI